MRPNYTQVFLTFARNSLVRDMTFRTNFVLQCITSVSWTLMNVGFYIIIFSSMSEHSPGRMATIGRDTGWGQNEFFVFLATSWFINSLVQAFFMPNAEEFSELIRTGNLDFALLKPIDTQFLVSFQKIEWSSLANFFAAAILLAYALWQLTHPPLETRPLETSQPAQTVASSEKTSVDQGSKNLLTQSAEVRTEPLRISLVSMVLYPFYILCGTAIMYSLMISLSATSIWLGRNQTLYNFWFYITNFSRYPMEIYSRGWGLPLWGLFTFVVPVLIVVNVPARLLAQPLAPRASWEWPLAGFAILATLFSLLASRWVFRRALLSYRSASS